MPEITAEQRALIGKESASRPAPYAANEAMAHHWSEMVEDPNPIYFDDAYAKRSWLEGTFAPPTMLFTWGRPLLWPESDWHGPLEELQLENCPATVAVNAVQEYEQPVRYGDTLSVTSWISSIGDEKTTRLGTGHFISTIDTFRNQRDEIVGTHTFTFFMYAPAGSA